MFIIKKVTTAHTYIIVLVLKSAKKPMNNFLESNLNRYFHSLKFTDGVLINYSNTNSILCI